MALRAFASLNVLLALPTCRSVSVQGLADFQTEKIHPALAKHPKEEVAEGSEEEGKFDMGAFLLKTGEVAQEATKLGQKAAFQATMAVNKEIGKAMVRGVKAQAKRAVQDVKRKVLNVERGVVHTAHVVFHTPDVEALPRMSTQAPEEIAEEAHIKQVKAEMQRAEDRERAIALGSDLFTGAITKTFGAIHNASAHLAVGLARGVASASDRLTSSFKDAVDAGMKREAELAVNGTKAEELP